MKNLLKIGGAITKTDQKQINGGKQGSDPTAVLAKCYRDSHCPGA